MFYILYQELETIQRKITLEEWKNNFFLVNTISYLSCLLAFIETIGVTSMKIQSVLHPWKSQIIHTFEPYTNMYILDKRHISDVIRRLYVHSRCNCKRGYSKLLYFWKNVFHMKFSKGDKKAIFFHRKTNYFPENIFFTIPRLNNFTDSLASVLIFCYLSSVLLTRQ